MRSRMLFQVGLGVALTVARALVMESSVGISLGHEETRACVERWLGLLEATPGKRARRSKK